MNDADLADLIDLLRVYAESFPEEAEISEKFRVKAMNHFREQTGETNILPYLINRRGAGRKPSITDEQKQLVKDLHDSGEKLKDIATATGLSIGAVHYILNPGTRK